MYSRVLIPSLFEEKYERSLYLDADTLVIGDISALDKVAYVRFASVYKNFKEAKDFEEFVGNINENKS